MIIIINQSVQLIFHNMLQLKCLILEDLVLHAKMPRGQEEVYPIDLEFCLFWVSPIFGERIFLFFTNRVENEAFLTEKCKTEDNLLVECSRNGCRATLLPYFQHKCSTVVTSELDLQVGKADRIDHAILFRFKYFHGNRNVIFHNVYKCSSLVLLHGHNEEKEVLTLLVIKLY